MNRARSATSVSTSLKTRSTPARFQVRRARTVTRPVKLIFVGRLVPYKGADMLLHAAAPLIRDGSVTVDILGDGSQMPQLREIVAAEKLGVGVRFVGRVKHEELQSWLANSDLFTFPSVGEFGGAVVLEAMAVGTVPVVVDYGGPSELVTSTTGFRITIGSRAKIITELRQLLAELVADPRRIDACSEPTRQRVFSNFTWAAKARQTVEVYRWLLGQSHDKPYWPAPLPD